MRLQSIHVMFITHFREKPESNPNIWRFNMSTGKKTFVKEQPHSKVSTKTFLAQRTIYTLEERAKFGLDHFISRCLYIGLSSIDTPKLENQPMIGHNQITVPINN